MKTIAKILFGLILIITLYIYGGIDPKLIDFSYNSIYLYLIVIIFISLTIALNALRLYIIFNILKFKISFTYIFKITYIGNFFNQCLPGATGGDIVKVLYLIKEYKFLNKISLISCIIIDRFFGLIVLSGLYLISLYFLADYNKNLLNLFYISLILFFFAILLIYLFIYFDFIHYLDNRIKNKQNYFANIFKKYLCDLRNLKNFNKLNIFKLLVISTISFILSICGIIILRGISYINLNSIIIMFFMSSVTFFANSVPLSFNGLGIGEYVFSQLSKVFYENNSAHFGNIFLMFRVLIILSSLPGLVIFIIFKNKFK